MIAENISEYLSEKGIRQKAVADAIGISPQSMSQTLKCERTLTADEYAEICKFLEVPYGKFIN